MYFILLVVLSGGFSVVNGQTLSAYIASNNYSNYGSAGMVSSRTDAVSREDAVIPFCMPSETLTPDLMLVENEDKGFECYMGTDPEPVRDFYTISFETKDICSFRIEMFDMTGKTLISENVSGTDRNFRYSLYMSDYYMGVYILRIVSGKNDFTRNFKIQKY